MDKEHNKRDTKTGKNHSTLKANLKGCVFSFDLNVGRSVQNLMNMGTEIKREGSAIVKNLLP